LEVKLESRGGKIKHQGWKPEKVKFIVIEFHGKVSSRYTFPINPKDAVREIIIRIEE